MVWHVRQHSSRCLIVMLNLLLRSRRNEISFVDGFQTMMGMRHNALFAIGSKRIDSISNRLSSVKFHSRFMDKSYFCCFGCEKQQRYKILNKKPITRSELSSTSSSSSSFIMETKSRSKQSVPPKSSSCSDVCNTNNNEINPNHRFSQGGNDDNDNSLTALQRQQQLWLDLRDTAVNPIEAINFLQELIQNENINQYIDKILISSESRIQINNGNNKNKKRNCNHIEILFTGDNQQDLLLRSSDEITSSDLCYPKTHSNDSNIVGKILKCNEPPSGIGLDPLAALDITSMGHWLVIESSKNNKNNNQWVQQQVSSMVQFLSSSTARVSSDPAKSSGSLSFTSTSSSSGLHLGFSTSDNNNNKLKIAICCPTHTALVTMDAILTECHCMNAMGATSVTDSGLLIPAMTTTPSVTVICDVEVDNDRNENNLFLESSSSSLQTALVLPFDSDLWKTAIDLRTHN